MVRPRRWAEIDDRRLRALWETALSIEAIGFEMDRNPRTVRDNALKLGLPPREPRHPKAMLHRVARRASDAHRS